MLWFRFSLYTIYLLKVLMLDVQCLVEVTEVSPSEGIMVVLLQTRLALEVTEDGLSEGIMVVPETKLVFMSGLFWRHALDCLPILASGSLHNLFVYAFLLWHPPCVTHQIHKKLGLCPGASRTVKGLNFSLQSNEFQIFHCYSNKMHHVYAPILMYTYLYNRNAFIL